MFKVYKDCPNQKNLQGKFLSNIFLSYTVKIFFKDKSKILDVLMVWLRPVNDKKKELKAINQSRKKYVICKVLLPSISS